MQISFGICTFNRSKDLRNLLINLVPQTDENCEIIVVDDGSTDDTPDVLNKFASNIRAFPEKNAGLAAARQKIVEQARGEFIVFFDDDAIPNPYWLTNFRRLNEVHQGTFDVMGGPAFPAFNGLSELSITQNLAAKLSINCSFRNQALRKVTPIGANMVIRRKLFDGFAFDQRLGRKGDSLDSNEETALFMTVAPERILFCRELSVLHVVPSERLNEDWILKRYFAEGVSYMRVIESDSKAAIFYLTKLIVAMLLASGIERRARYQQLLGALGEFKS